MWPQLKDVMQAGVASARIVDSEHGVRPNLLKGRDQ